jgi:small subunit ribosomal protein S4
MESQFRKYMDEAFNTPGVTGTNLLRSLERRLDNVIYLLGFADSRKQARQFVLHGHFQINGRKTDVPSYSVKAGDAITWREADKTSDFFAERTTGLPRRPVPPWLGLDLSEMSGRVVALPSNEELQTTLDSRLIVEFYSR